MKKGKRNQIYNDKKAHDQKDRLFVVLIILILLLCINILFIYFTNKEKQTEKNKQLKKQEELIDEIERKEKIRYGDIIFLGDSITDYYDLDEYYDFPIVNSGVAGWTTDDILNHLNEKVFQYDSEKLVLLIGTNDINHDKDCNYIVSNIEKIVNEIKEKKPKVKLYIESIYPINNTNSEKIDQQIVGKRTNEVINSINQKLKKYCKLNDIQYINMYDVLLDEEGNLNLNYTKEGLHINEKGYKIITKEILKTLDI